MADCLFPACLQCKKENVDSLPILEDEFYKVGFPVRGGVELMFDTL